MNRIRVNKCIALGHRDPAGQRKWGQYSSRFYVEIESLVAISVHDESLNGVTVDAWHDFHKTVK